MSVSRGSSVLDVGEWSLERVAVGAAALAVLAYGLGDGLTTAVLFSRPALGEANPVVRALWPWGFVAAKLVVLALPVVALEVGERVGRVEPVVVSTTFSVVLALLGGYATVHNVMLF